MQKGIDYIGVSVVYFCHDGKGNVVMAKRTQNARDEKGKWDIGGGAMELYETVEQALRKEIKEEYNCDVLSYEFLGIREVHRMNQNAKTHWIALDYKVLVDTSDLKTNEPQKFDEVRLFPISEMIREPQLVHSQLPEFLEKYKDKIKTA
jgi:8-oxo-dGTP diphosphatase